MSMRNKWLLGGLAASLIVNLLLIGFVVGKMTSGWAMPPMRPDPTMGLHRMIDFLPDPRRDEIRDELKTQMRSIYPELRELRATHRRIRDAVTADPFVRTDLEKALEELRARLGSTQVSAHRAFVDVVSRLTPEERAQLADAMRRPRGFGRDRRHNHRDEHRDTR
jgi:uncharacterized membrane protein